MKLVLIHAKQKPSSPKRQREVYLASQTGLYVPIGNTDLKNYHLQHPKQPLYSDP